jgi:hypothetical protein
MEVKRQRDGFVVKGTYQHGRLMPMPGIFCPKCGSQIEAETLNPPSSSVYCPIGCTGVVKRFATEEESNRWQEEMFRMLPDPLPSGTD